MAFVAWPDRLASELDLSNSSNDVEFARCHAPVPKARDRIARHDNAGWECNNPRVP